MAAWVVGNLILLYYNLVLHVMAPFPSMADAAFLVLPCTVVIASTWTVRTGRLSALRPVLDGFIIAGALFMVSWVLVLEHLFQSTSSSPLASAVSIAFPISDVVMITLTVLTLSASVPGQRHSIGLVCLGLVVIAVADTIWIFVRAQTQSTSPIAAIGWATGLVLLSAGGLTSARRRTTASGVKTRRQRSTDHLIWLPYGPLMVALIVGFLVLWPKVTDKPELIAAAVLMGAAMVRQLIVLVENRRLMYHVTEQARRDPLTGLGNRLMLTDQIDAAIASRKHDELPVAVLVLDLDDFKMINENLGRHGGDGLLVEVANRLKAGVPPEQTIARLGGDAFAILIRSESPSAVEIAERVAESFDAPFAVNSEELFIHPSIGLAVVPADERDVTSDELMMRADVALEVSKRTGIGGVRTFSTDMNEASALQFSERWTDSGRIRLPASIGLQLLGQLRRAINDGELKLAYQPKVSMADGVIVGVEALLRWPHPELGLLSPSEFLPLVRRNGLIAPVTDLVLDQAARDAATWFDAETCDVPVAINLFAPSMTDLGLTAQIEKALARHALPARALTVEITEHLVLANISRAQVVVDQLRAAGLKVSIDDFGSGFSTMSYLRDLPVDELKLDRDFIGPILHNPRAAAIVQSIIDLTRALDIVSVAEGVEDAATARRLAEYGCDVGQGFYFARPVFADTLRSLMATRKTLHH